MSENPFPGADFARDPLTPEECASFREMRRELGNGWPYLSPIIQISRGGKSLSKILVVAAAIGAAIAWAVNQGYFQ